MYHIHIQHIASRPLALKLSLLRQWAKQALATQIKQAEVTIRIVDSQEMATLNSTYRHKQGPTNVLSFPMDLPAEMQPPVPILGDIIICSEVVDREAREQHKSREAHWAHMIVHGIFHLLGFDHEQEKEAEQMEALEIKVMRTLGFPDPYADGESIKNYD